MTDRSPTDPSELYPPPVACPACGGGLLVTRLHCPNCRTEVSGTFAHPADPESSAGQIGGQPTRLVNLPEPYASLLELFIRVRGNVKDVERELRLSYPTVRARLDEAFKAARPLLEATPPDASSASVMPTPPLSPDERASILSALERGEITAAEATTRLRHPHPQRSTPQ